MDNKNNLLIPTPGWVDLGDYWPRKFFRPATKFIKPRTSQIKVNPFYTKSRASRAFDNFLNDFVVGLLISKSEPARLVFNIGFTSR